MGTVNDITQKIKGKAQQLKGELEIENGDGVQGTVDKLKGKANEAMADWKLQAKENQVSEDLD